MSIYTRFDIWWMKTSFLSSPSNWRLTYLPNIEF